MSDSIDEFKEKLNREFAEAAANSVTIPRAAYEALLGAEKALEPFDEFAAKVEKERPGWYHDQFSLFRFMHSIGGEYDVLMKWFIGARKARAALRAAGVIEETKPMFVVEIKFVDADIASLVGPFVTRKNAEDWVIDNQRTLTGIEGHPKVRYITWRTPLKTPTKKGYTAPEEFIEQSVKKRS